MTHFIKYSFLHAKANLGALFKILIAPPDLVVADFIPHHLDRLFARYGGQSKEIC